LSNGFRVIVLGTLDRVDGRPALVVDYGPRGVKAHLLTEEQYESLTEWDPTEWVTDPSVQTKELLKALEGLGAICVVREGADLRELDVRVVRRQNVAWRPAPDGGTLFEFANGQTLEGNEVDLEVISRADGYSTLGRLVSDARDTWQRDQPAEVRQLERNANKPFSEIMLDEALGFVGTYCGFGLISLEPVS